MVTEDRKIKFSTEEISRAIGVRPLVKSPHYQWIDEIIIDTRSAFDGKYALFIGLKGSLSHGNDYALAAHQKGVRSFILTSNRGIADLHDSTIFVVGDAIKALQSLARYKRINCTHTKVISITGSAGKTIVKEWLAQCLSQKYATIQSPKSYNSQIGVPLSVWNMQAYHQIGIFEAGISRPGEMENLRLIIQPEIGILTNIGSAHDAGFESRAQKLDEKLQLFLGCKALIYKYDDVYDQQIKSQLNGVLLVSWSKKNEAAFLQIKSEEKGPKNTTVEYKVGQQTYSLKIPFVDESSLENAYHVLTTLHYLGEGPQQIVTWISELRNLPLRLEVSNISNNVSLINDAYINDLTSLKIALDFSLRYRNQRKLVLVVSDIQESGIPVEEMERTLLQLGSQYNPDTVYYLSSNNTSSDEGHGANFQPFNSYDDLQKVLVTTGFKDSVILIKGARKYGLERLFYKLKQKNHTAKLTINLSAIEHNIAYYKSLTKPETKIMAVIKGSAYGSGAEAIGQLLEHKGIDYLSVANIDEGKQLRQAGVSLPLVILNPDGLFVEELLQYKLEVEVFSLYQLQNLLSELFNQEGQLNIHLKLDTGMHRLGFMEEEITKLVQLLLANETSLHVSSIFSHLASSEDPNDDSYTNDQFELFDRLYQEISASLGYQPLKHILNTAGIARFGHRDDDMVRLGLGLYGIDSTGIHAGNLEKAHSLTASIIQTKKLKKGDFVGYNRRGQVERDSTIGIVNIGYADGFLRRSGNDNYNLQVENNMAPIIGNVCMDLTIIDITDIPQAVEGSVVTIFGTNPSIENLAEVCQTIPYEIISRLAPRIVRDYVF